MKLYKLTTKGLGSYFVLADDPSSAEKTLDIVLDGNSYGMFMDRDVTEIQVIANGYMRRDGLINLDNRRNGVIIVGIDVAEGIAKAICPGTEPKVEPVALVKDEIPSKSPDEYSTEIVMTDREAGEILHSIDDYVEVRIFLQGEKLNMNSIIEVIYNEAGSPAPVLRTTDLSQEKLTYYDKEVNLQENTGLPYVTASLYWLMTQYGGPHKTYAELIQMIKEKRIQYDKKNEV